MKGQYTCISFGDFAPSEPEPGSHRLRATIGIATSLFIAHAQQLVACKGPQPEQTRPEQGQR
jgi:hypothetical protein